MTPLLALTVVVAGALGAAVRYLIGHAGRKASWPWPVLLVNAVGSLVAGVAIHTDLALVVVTGFGGGLTTFSTFSVETVQLAGTGRWRAAAANVAANLALGVAAATAGWLLGGMLLG